jgi:hypothetical protein
MSTAQQSKRKTRVNVSNTTIIIILLSIDVVNSARHDNALQHSHLNGKSLLSINLVIYSYKDIYYSLIDNQKHKFCSRLNESHLYCMSTMVMSNRLDILIFGATGYTGQYVIEEMARKAQKFDLKWGIAGRTVNKLQQVLQQASVVTGVRFLVDQID